MPAHNELTKCVIVLWFSVLKVRWFTVRNLPHTVKLSKLLYSEAVFAEYWVPVLSPNTEGRCICIPYKQLKKISNRAFFNRILEIISGNHNKRRIEWANHNIKQVHTAAANSKRVKCARVRLWYSTLIG